MREVWRDLERGTPRGESDNRLRRIQEVLTMADRKLPLPTVVHLCPVCHRPQTKIQRKLGNDQHGATNYVCARSECVVGINLTKVETWTAV
jgi:hypothetical protein